MVFQHHDDVLSSTRAPTYCGPKYRAICRYIPKYGYSGNSIMMANFTA